MGLYTSRVESILVEENERISALVDVEVFQSNFYFPKEVRLCFLEQNHVIRVHHSVVTVPLLLRIVGRVWSLNFSPTCWAMIPSSGLMSFIGLQLGCEWLPAFVVTRGTLRIRLGISYLKKCLSSLNKKPLPAKATG